MENLVAIKTFLDRYEAEVAKGLLDEKGVEAIVSADDVGGYIPNRSFGANHVRLLIKKEDTQKAQEVLKVLESPAENQPED